MALLSPMIFLIVIIFVFIIRQGSYIAFGVTDSSLREALLDVLKKMNMSFEETLGHIKLPSVSAELQVSVQSWIGTGQIRLKGNTDKELLTNIARGMNRYFQETDTKTNMTICIFYLLMALFMLVFGFNSYSRVQSLSGYYLTTPKDISKYKIPSQIVDNNALQAYKSQYLVRNDHKAFVYSSDGPYGYCTNKTTADHAKDCALKYCLEYWKKGNAPCKVLSVDGNPVVN